MIRYLRRKLAERSTIAGLLGPIPVAAALPSPFCWVMLAVGVVLVLYPEDPPDAPRPGGA